MVGHVPGNDEEVGLLAHRADLVGKPLERTAWGAEMRSCSSAVLMEETTEPIAAANLTSLTLEDDARTGGWIRRLQPKRRCGR
jgi:hypothetical protein